MSKSRSQRYVDPQAPLDTNNLPITSYGSADPNAFKAVTPNYKVPDQPLGDTGSANYVGDQYQRSSLDNQNIYQEDIPNIEDERANNQSTIGALGDATAKFVGKTMLSTVGNLAGTIYGVSDAIAKGDVTKIWDNSFIEAVDAGNKKLDNIFQVYKNSDFQQQNILQKLFLHPTQFADEATDTASFMAGAILSEIATSGLGSETIVPKALKYMKYLSEGAEASEATNTLTSLATKGITLAGDLGTSIKHLAMGASYEGIVEARQATMELRQKMEEDYSKDHPGEDIPDNVKNDIDDRLSKAGVFTYLSNLALVGGTNLLLFPKLFGLGHETAKVAEGSIVKDAETGLFKATKDSHSLLDNVVTGLTKPVEESTKFGVQGTISKTNKEFFDRKHDEDAKEKTSNYLETFAKQLADTYTTKEGWNNIGMGMIIGALGAPGRGILSSLGKDHVLGKYGYKDITDENGNIIDKEKLPLWQGGVAGSFHERAEQEAKIGKIVNDLNQHTNFFKAAQANYNTLVENNSLQKDQDEALKNNDIFNFQNAKDDQIHSYVSARIKNNLYDDLLDEVNKMKKLSPDEFYSNFKGDEAADKATKIEKLKFQLETTNQFLEKAKNTRDAIKISDNVYRGDNEDLRDHLTHSIAASKNLDLREKLMNQSIADLSDGMLSNLNLRTSKESVGDIMSRLQEINPTAYTLNKDKIQQLLEDSEKLRTKRQDYLDVYNHLFTQEGQKQFQDHQDKEVKEAQDKKVAEDKAVVDKQTEDIKKENNKQTVKKAKDLNVAEKDAVSNQDDINNLPDDIKTGKNLTKKNATNVSLDDDTDNLPTDGTKDDSGDTNITEPITNTPIENNGLEVSNTGLETIPKDDTLDPEENAIVNIENNKELATQREVTVTDTGLALNDKVESYQETSNQLKLVNLDLQRTIGNTIAYLGVDKIRTGKLDREAGVVNLRTLDIFNENGNIEINKFVDPKLFSQNHYTINTPLELFIPTYDEMDERGLQDYSNSDYQTKIDNLEEYPIAIRNNEGKIIGYIPTQSSINRLVAPEFKEQALKDNLSLRNFINQNRESSYKTTITSKSPGFVISDLYTSQKSLFDALGDGTKLADKVKLGIVKVERDLTGANREATPNDLRVDMSSTPFKEGIIVNDKALKNGVVYAILPSSAKEQYIVYPTKVNTIGVNNARTITEAIKIFAKGTKELTKEEKDSISNIGDFNIDNFKDLNDFVNKIMYASSGVNAGDKTIFKLFKNKLILSSLEDQIFPLEDIVNSQEVRNKIVDILADRYYSVGLENLNSNTPYISYHLNEDTGTIEEKHNDSYQHYINDNKVLTSNIRGVHIENNEYAFTAQPVIGLSNTISRDTKQISSQDNKEEENIEDAKVIEETSREREIETKPEEKPIRKTKKTTIDPNRIKKGPLNDINPEDDKFKFKSKSNPNKSVIDKLFVDINKFSDSQQREIVDSIIYAIEEGKKEGYSTVEDLFDYAKDIFANNKDAFSDMNDDGSLDKQVQVFSDIEDNWSKFREKTLDKLKGIGYKITKVFEENKDDIPNSERDDSDIISEDSESPESNFIGTEATYRRNEYLDNESTSSKDTASAHLKLKLSLIPEVEMVGDRLEPSVNYLSMSKFMDLNKVWTSLQGVLTGLPTDQIYPTITELAKSNPMYSTILSNINDDPNTAIQNEFIVAFSKQQSKPLTTKIGYADKFGNRTINVFGTNRQGANDILIDKWYDSFKTSPLIKDDGEGNLIINTIEAQKSLNSFNKFIENYNIKDLNLSKNLQRGLASIGIDLSLATTDNLIKNSTNIDGRKYSAKEFLDKYVSLIFKRVAGNFDISNKIENTRQLQIGEEDIENNKLSLNNPFISETKALDALAKLENITNPFLYESSYVGGDGKPRYSITNNNYISKFFNTLNDPERGIQRITEILSTTYASNSIWGRKYISDAKFREDFKFHPLDSLGTNESKVTNKTFNKMSSKEKEYTRMGLFQNVGRNTSIFMAPIPSDKTTLPLIQVTKTKVVIDPSNLRIRNSEAINALYTPFVAEYNRIRETQSQNINPEFKDRLIEGYHNGGMGEKFLVYDFLNKNSELFDESGKLKIVDDITLRKIVTPEIEKFTTDLIKKQIRYWNKLGLDNNKSFDKSYKRKLGDFGEREIYSDLVSSKADKAKMLEVSTKSALRAFAADYAINQFLAHFNYTQLISGDPALHGKATIGKTWINYSKRLAKDIAPGLDGNFINPKFTTVFLKDLKYSSKHLNEYQEVLGDKASAYRELNPADAQEYTTLKEHLAIMDAYGKLTPLLKAAGERLMSGEEDPFDIDLILQPQKPVYVGTQVDNSMGINRMYYVKTSAFPLIPSLTKGLEIDKLRVAMEDPKNGADRAVYESGVKLGLGTNSISIEKSQGVFNDTIDLKDKGVTLDRDGFRIQQEVPFHGNHEKFVNEGSQGRKLIFSDVDDYSSINTLGTTLTGKGAKQVYESLHVEKMNRAFSKLLKDIGVDSNNKIKDLSKLQKILIDEATSRNYNINDIYGLQIERDENGIQRFTIPLGFNNSSNRLESIMNSLFTNRVIKSELPGFSKVQGSSAGFSRIRTLDQINSQVKDSIVWMNPKDTELNYIRKNSDGTKLLQADILVPSWFTDSQGKDIDLTKFVKEDGTLDTDRLPESLLTTIGLRIPTQGLNSMMSFKVKGFLPKMVGDLAIVPPEIVAQMGSDFDVDKLYMYRYHHKYDENTNSFKKIEAPEVESSSNIDEEGNMNDTISNKFNKYSDEELDNSIIQMFQDRYEETSLLGKILEPNGFGDLPKLAEEISYLLNKDKESHFFTTEQQNTIHKNNNDGKAGTGIFSLFSTFIKAAQDAQLRLADPVTFLLSDGRLIREDRLFGKGQLDKTPSTIISYLQSASVDNAKEQILGSLNINSRTMDVAGTIALAGFDEQYIAYFLSQPIIKDLVQELENSDDITNPEYNVNKESDAQRKVEDKYELKSSEDQAIYITNIKGDLGAEGVWFSPDSMRTELESPTNLNQRLLLNKYLRIKESAKAIRLVQNAISTDTGGLGIRYVDLQIRRNNVELAQTNPLISNVDRLFSNNTQIGKATEVLNRALNIYKEILPYETPGYKYAINSILENMGKADKATLYAKDLTDTYNSIKSYLYSTKSLLDLDNINIERQRLLYGTQALGNRWEAYTKTPAGKKNLLSERIQVRRTTNLNDPIRLQALNTPAANSSDNNDAMAAYYNMYHKGTDEEKVLAKDLVNYFILTGAKQGANSISKYIPYDILESHNFSDKLHQIDSDLRDNKSGNLLANVVEQYFQHNPNKAPMFDIKNSDISDYKIEGFKMKLDSQYLIPNESRNLVPSTYMSVYNNKIKNFLLYKIAKSTTLGTEYTRIDLLGDSNISEYNANAKEGQYSIIKSNSSGIAIPSDVTRVEQENKEDDKIFTQDTPKEAERATAIPIDKEYLTKKYNLDNTNPESTLNNIIDGSNKEYSDIASDLKRLLVNYPNLTIDSNLDENGISGRFADGKISINLDNILSRNKDATTATERVILHEMLHAITANKIDNYNNLSSEDKKLVDKIKILFNQYRTNTRTKESIKFDQLLDKYKKDKDSLTNEEIDFIRDNKGKYYALSNLHEFIAAGLTDDAFVEQLKDNNFWKKLWTAISNLLGLNESYKNDYDALYSNVLKLGDTKDTSNDSNIVDDKGLNDLSPRDTKTEFLSKYHLWDGKEMSLNGFNKVQSSMKANDKYKNISIDLAWENNKRVLRVFTKGGIPLYDINPEPVIPKTKEEKIIDKSLKYYNDIINKFKSNANYSTNPDLQSRVEVLQAKVKQIRAENTISIITSSAKDNLANIENTLNKDKISTYDVQENKTFLAFYKNIRKIITYNEAFEEENKNLDLIARKAGELEKILKEKELDLIKSWTKTNLNLKTNISDVFNTSVREVGKFESKWESGAFSTDKGIQFIQNMISKTEQKSYDTFHEYSHTIRPLIKEYLSKHKDYKELLQYNKNGEWTGGLINKYSQDYYDELTKRKGNPKEFSKFFKENTEQKVTEEGKKQFEQDVNILREELPEYNIEGTHDYAKYTQWFSSHNPDLYLAKVKQGKFITREERSKYKNYISQTPVNKWLDPKYQKLKKLGEDSIEMKLYRELDSQFRAMNKISDNNANYIPELKKDFAEKILDGQWKGSFNLLKEQLQDAVSIKLDATTNFNTLDSDGVPNKTTPVYMMSNTLNPKDKSNDLGKVLLMAKLQDILLNHKSEVEPYLNSARDLLIDRPAYVLNRSGNIVYNDITNEPEEDTSIGRASNASGQINFIIDKFLYDKEKEQSGVSKTASINRSTINNKGEVTTESRAVAASKVMDTFSKYTRLKALGYNPVSSIGRILWGTLSNTIYAGDRKSYDEKSNIRALKAILEWSLPGTAMNKKINTLAEYFNMRKELNEIKFGKLKIPTPKNPLASFGPYTLVDKGENFIQYHTGVSVLMTQKIINLEGKSQSIWDAFDKDGKWREDKFGSNPYLDDKSRLDLSTLVQNTITAVHGDYGDAIQANDEVISRQLLVMRRWLPRSIAVRFGREYTDLATGDKVKGRYRSYELSHLNPLNLVKDFYKSFTIDPSEDNIDARNLRMNAYELAFIPVLWGMTLAMRGMLKGLYHDDDKEKAALTFLLNSSTRVSGDLTFFFNPYSFQAVMREPIPAFKTIMDFYDLGPAVVQTVEGKGNYKVGIHKGDSKLGVKLAKAVPIINQPEKAYSAIKQEIEK